MSAPPPLDVDEFSAFFQAVHGHDPFPWQTRLAQQVAADGWPKVLDLPTGSGKTAALDVAVFTLALDADRTPRQAPLRIVYVVDRRTIVDQAYDRAAAIRAALVTADSDVVRRVRERLLRFMPDGTPLQTALLRGGIAREDSWARSPDQPLIAVSTVDQVGSRLLFRGYGVSDSMKPVHAGLLGCDVLYLLDEVHLSQPFRETLVAIRDRYQLWAERPLPPAFVVVEMSATPGARSESVFQLEEADRQNPTLLARLRASKPASLSSANPRAFANEIERHVLSMVGRPGATIAVVVNRVNSARELHRSLRETIPEGPDRVHLLTGRMRPFDRDALEHRLLGRIRSGRARHPDEPPIVVVATQSIEAGADFDFDGLVTECASLDALRQRFGRLDRLGVLAGSARGAIVARTDSLKDDPVYGGAIGRTWEWLRAQADGLVVDFGIDALMVPQDAHEQGLLAPKAHAPILLPSHLDAWVQTSPLPEPDPDVALWLHGPRSGPADVQIVWRMDLTNELLAQATAGGENAKRAEEIALDMVEALPPVSAEAMSVPFVAARRWLDGRAEPDSFDVEGAADGGEIEKDNGATSPPRAVIVWQGEQSRIVLPREVRPGQTIVVPSSYGGIAYANWDPQADVPVKDVAELAASRYRRRPVARLHEAVIRGLFNLEADARVEIPRPSLLDEETTNDREMVVGWLGRQDVTEVKDDLRDLLNQLRSDEKSLRIERLPLGLGEDAGHYFVITGKRRAERAETDDVVDDRAGTDATLSSFTGVEVLLADHQAGVADTAFGIAQRVSLSDDLAADLRIAGEWHDAGKADPRFQRWLHGGSEFKAFVQSAPLAKSACRLASRAAVRRARERAGYPAGARHELMSLALMASARLRLADRTHDWALVQHLVASHHGHCRALAPWVSDPNPTDVSFAQDGITCCASSAHELARLDSGVAERFWKMTRKYGWWGLAFLEALFRLADHRQSEGEERSGGRRRG